MNKQPFYHRVEGLLFTCTQPVSEEEFLIAVKKALKPFGCVTLEIECIGTDGELESGYMEPEAGDPLDLV